MKVLPFSDISDKDQELVGGKAASLAKLTQSGIPVPTGFVVTTEVNEESLEQETQDSILQQFDTLGAARVAVRSSAIAEDSSVASWAGQLETYLNVDRNDMIARIKDCWKSIKSARAKAYAENKKLEQEDLRVAVIVQEMVDSEAAGVAFSVNPITNDPQEIVIEAGWGLGESVVQGDITPESIMVSKQSHKIISKTPARQEKMLLFSDGKNRNVPAPQSQDVLSLEQTKELTVLVEKIANLYGRPMDIEWALADGKFYIVQARPITTLSQTPTQISVSKVIAETIAKGKVGSIGLASGKARVVTELAQISEVQPGEVLVAVKTTPDYVEVFTKVAAIVTDIGGATSHAAIVSRELGIPAVVDTVNGTRAIKTGDIITVNGYSGEVYAGEVETISHESKPSEYKIAKTGNEIDDLLNSMTGVFVDVRDLWPLPPINLFPYFDLDQSLGTYLKLKQLVDEGMSFKDIAKLFKRAEQVRYFLINTGPASLKVGT